MSKKVKLSFVCTDRTPLVQGEIRDKPGRCFKKGLKAGFAAGTERATKLAQQKATIAKPRIEAAAQAINMSKYKSVRVEDATNDMRKVYLQQLGVPNYRNMSMAESILRLRAAGITRILVPRKQ